MIFQRHKIGDDLTHTGKYCLYITLWDMNKHIMIIGIRIYIYRRPSNWYIILFNGFTTQQHSVSWGYFIGGDRHSIITRQEIIIYYQIDQKYRTPDKVHKIAGASYIYNVYSYCQVQNKIDSPLFFVLNNALQTIII